MTQTPLTPDQLYHPCDPASLGDISTAEHKDTQPGLGQLRAQNAIEFGIGMRHDGYNIYVAAPSGAGKQRFVRHVLQRSSGHKNKTFDWCYLHNFSKPNQPVYLQLPCSIGAQLKRDMEKAVLRLLSLIPDAFDNELHQTQINNIEQSFIDKRDEAMAALRREAQKDQIDFIRTPSGFAFVPMRDNKVLDNQAYDKLSKSEQEHIENAIKHLQDELQTILQQIPKWQQEAKDAIQQINQETAKHSIDALLEEIKAKYADYPKILAHIDAIEADVIDNLGYFQNSEANLPNTPVKLAEDPFLRRYLINLLVEHDDEEMPPITYELNPTHDNLLGKVDHLSHMGTLYTDFTLIQSGALHRANGGYLLIDAHKLLQQPLAWEALKRCIASQQIRIESLGKELGFISTVSLEPQPIPLDTKVILMGDRRTYYLLCEYEPDFPHLFKVYADFEDEIDRDTTNTAQMARLIVQQSKDDQLLPFSTNGIARTVEHASRQVEDAEKLSTHLGHLGDLLKEADFWARASGNQSVESEHVQKAIDEAEVRQNRIATHYRENILRGSTRIETDGEHVGQINALTIIQLGDHDFGQPSRITATARAGENKVVDIEHEADLGGDIHTKGVLIMSSFLHSYYALNRNLSLSASIVFEQSYGPIDGDSASAAELCALLSAIARLPIKQQIAITGAVDQCGNIQAIGGVNEKIEGFFDICQARGLTGQQGVIIPSSNIPNLMLKQNVREAVTNQQFHIYGIAHINQALEILTGRIAGDRDEKQQFPQDSVNAQVEAALLAMCEVVHAEHEENHDSQDNKSHAAESD